MRVPRLILDLVSAVTLGAFGLWVFHHHVTGEAHGAYHPYAYHDLFALYYPFFDFAASSLRDGHLPLWNPYQLAGLPFLAALEPGTYYPPNALYLLLPIDRAMWLTTVLHVLLAGSLAALYARLALGVSRIAALAAGTVFMASTYTLWMAFALTQLHAIAWMPLLFLGVDRSIRSPRPGWALAIAAGLALPILGGNLQLLTYEMYALLPYAIGCVLDARRAREGSFRPSHALACLLLGGALGLLIAAPQVIPTVELSRLSARPPGGLTAQQMKPLGAVPWTGFRALLDGSREPLSFLFTGATVLLLIGFAFLSRGTRGRAAALALAGVLAACLSFGPGYPIGRAFIRLPTGDWFRDLQRAWPVTVFALASLGALGLEAIRGWPSHGRRRAAGSGAVLLITAVLVILAPPSVRPIVLGGGATLLLLTAGFLSARGRSVAALLLVIFLGLELDRSLPLNRNVLPFVGDAYRALYAAQGILEWAHGQDPTRRLLHQEVFLEFPTAPKLGTLFRVPVFSDYEALVPRRYEAWTRRMTGGLASSGANVYMGTVEPPFFLSSDPRFLDYAAVGHVILFDFDPRRGVPPIVAGMEPVRVVRLPTASELGAGVPELDRVLGALVYRNPFAWPRVFLAHDIRRVRNGQEALRVLERLPRGTPPIAVVEGHPRIRLPPAATEDSLATLVSDEPERVEIRTLSPREALLVLSDTYFPGWSARIDNAPVPILRANHLFRAVAVPAGVHRIVFTYRPLSVRIGLGLGALGLAAAAALVVAGWRGRRRGNTAEGRA